MQICPYCKEQNPDGVAVCRICGRSLRPGEQEWAERLITSAHLVPGVVLAGRYELIEKVGQGGFGIVFKARDKRLRDRIVALKVLPPELASDERAIEDLKTEAEVAMALSHPNLMRLYNFEESGGICFLVMEFLEGPTLSQILAKRKRLTPEETIALSKQMCDGLAYAHSQKVVHRDLKPGNLMLAHPVDPLAQHLDAPEIQLKITDFGIARKVKDTMTRVSNRPTTGTLSYMSPEQLRGKAVDARSDIYSLGCVIYELLSGRPPFHTGDIYNQHLHEPPELLRDIPADLNNTILKCLEKDPAARWQNADEMQAALADKAVPERMPEPEPVAAPRPKRNTLLLASIALLLAAALGVIGYYISISSKPKRQMAMLKNYTFRPDEIPEGWAYMRYDDLLNNRFRVMSDFLNKQYTLSESSKRAVGRLKDLLTIKVYFSQKLPPNLIDLKHQVRDLLEEYRTYAKRYLRVEFIDPKDDPDLANNLQSQGIPQVQLNILEQDEYQVINVYLGMSIEYEDRREVIPVVRDLENLEYDITSAIVKVSNAQVRPIGLLTNNPDVNLKNNYRQINEALERQYSVRQIDLTQTQTIPRELAALIVISPQDFTNQQLYEIDQFFMNGGKLICLVDTVELEERSLDASVNVPNITNLLECYGVTVRNDLVADLRSHSIASFNTGFVKATLPYPFFVKVRKEGLVNGNPIVNRLESLVLPWTSSVQVGDTVPESMEVTRLASTTPYALSQQAPFDLNPQQRFSPKKEDMEQRSVGVLLKGKFTSYFKDKPVPQRTTETRSMPSAAPRLEEPETVTESGETQLLVVGSSRFITDRQLVQFPSNLLFMQNAVDCMALCEDLIDIRGLTEAKDATLRYLDMLGLAEKEPGLQQFLESNPGYIRVNEIKKFINEQAQANAVEIKDNHEKRLVESLLDLVNSVKEAYCVHYINKDATGPQDAKVFMVIIASADSDELEAKLANIIAKAKSSELDSFGPAISILTKEKIGVFLVCPDYQRFGPEEKQRLLNSHNKLKKRISLKEIHMTL